MKRYLLDFGDPGVIVVSKGGSDATGSGSWTSPVKTLAKALALASDSRPTILVLPGQYDEVGGLTWPDLVASDTYENDGVLTPILVTALAGPGSVIIGNTASAKQPVITIAPTAIVDVEVYLRDVEIYHADGQKGIKIDNTHCAHKLIVGLDGVSTSADTPENDSIFIVKGAVAPPMRLYAKNCDEIEGLVTLVVAHVNDHYHFTNCKLLGGLASTGGVAGEVTLLRCSVLTGACVVAAVQVFTANGCSHVTDHDVYTAFTEVNSAAAGYSV